MTSALRFLRQVVAPNGRHRKPMLQTEPAPHVVLDEDKTEAPEPTTPAGAA